MIDRNRISVLVQLNRFLSFPLLGFVGQRASETRVCNPKIRLGSYLNLTSQIHAKCHYVYSSSPRLEVRPVLGFPHLFAFYWTTLFVPATAHNHKNSVTTTCLQLGFMPIITALTYWHTGFQRFPTIMVSEEAWRWSGVCRASAYQGTAGDRQPCVGVAMSNDAVCFNAQPEIEVKQHYVPKTSRLET